MNQPDKGPSPATPQPLQEPEPTRSPRRKPQVTPPAHPVPAGPMPDKINPVTPVQPDTQKNPGRP